MFYTLILNNPTTNIDRWIQDVLPPQHRVYIELWGHGAELLRQYDALPYWVDGHVAGLLGDWMDDNESELVSRIVNLPDGENHRKFYARRVRTVFEQLQHISRDPTRLSTAV